MADAEAKPEVPSTETKHEDVAKETPAAGAVSISLDDIRVLGPFSFRYRLSMS